MLGRVGQGASAGVPGRLEHGDERRRPRPRPRRRRRLAHDGEDRALDRPQHRLVGRRGGGLERLGEPAPRAASSDRRALRYGRAMPRRIWLRMTPELPRRPSASRG